MPRIAALWRAQVPALHHLSELDDGALAEAAIEVNSATVGSIVKSIGPHQRTNQVLEIGDQRLGGYWTEQAKRRRCGFGVSLSCNY